MPKASKSRSMPNRGGRPKEDAVAVDGSTKAPPLPPVKDTTAASKKSGKKGASVEDSKQPSKETRAREFALGVGMETQESWNAMLFTLLLYKSRNNGNTNVKSDCADQTLYQWVLKQRASKADSSTPNDLTADRIAVLDTIGFQWILSDDISWNKHFENLTAYKAEFGDCRVPRSYDIHPKLGEWVTEQRRQHKLWSDNKASTMTEERNTKLTELGFVWKVRERADWNDRYEQLLEFKKETGHTVVPQHWPNNRPLGKWVAKQREQYRFYQEGKHSFLTDERIDLLKSCNFTWKIKGRGATSKSEGELKRGSASGGVTKEKSLVEMEEEAMEAEEMNMGTLRTSDQVIHMPNMPPSIHMPTIPQYASFQHQLLSNHALSNQAAQNAAMAQLARSISRNVSSSNAAMHSSAGQQLEQQLGQQLEQLQQHQI